MKNKLSFLVFAFICIPNIAISQSLDDCKYIIIPEKYDFLKSEDQYKLISLTKFLFEKEGFPTLLKSEKMPNDLYENPCLGLYVDVIKSSNLLSTVLEITLKNCRKETILKSKKGKSRLKEYKRSYHEALRNAFASLKNLNYNYTPKTTENTTLNEENSSLNNTSENAISLTNQSNTTANITATILYAQKTKNGFQLVDSSPKVLYTLLHTSQKTVYLLKSKKGFLYKTNDKWTIEYYEKDKLITKILNIKF